MGEYSTPAVDNNIPFQNIREELLGEKVEVEELDTLPSVQFRVDVFIDLGC